MFTRLPGALMLLAFLLGACSSLKPSSTPSPQVLRGSAVFKSYCARCHSTSGETVIVGPSLAGIATRGNGRVEGMDAKTYIQNSILDPGAYRVEGFPEGLMPQDLLNQLPPEDLDAVVEYLLTLE